jgi:predicted metal-dependent HD superfamily phosphohydrolase
MQRYFLKLYDDVIQQFRELLPERFYYHSLQHTLDVVKASEEIAGREGKNEAEIDLLKTAALFHDTGFFYTITHHEEKGCEIAASMLQQAGATPDYIDQIQQLILATRMPQQPKSELEMIICDADLDYLGRDDYETISELLFREMNRPPVTISLSEWTDIQIRFLQSHHYFTPSSQQLRTPGKLKQIERLQGLKF